jgi:hypothetical protein
VTLTLNADGSGTLSIVPFAGSGLAVSFPAGTVSHPERFAAAGSYSSPNRTFISFSVVSNGNSVLSGSLTINTFNINGDSAEFDNLSLNRQG